MDVREIGTDAAPQAIGPYSQAVAAGGFVFVSGQIPIDPKTGLVIPGGIAEQAGMALSNLKAVLEASGSSMSRVVKTTVFLKDLGDFEAFNKVYSSFFTPPYPARSCVEVSRLPRGALVEVEAVALPSEHGAKSP